MCVVYNVLTLVQYRYNLGNQGTKYFYSTNPLGEAKRSKNHRADGIKL